MSLTLLGCGATAASTVGPLDGISGLTGAWSMSRKLVGTYAGNFYHTTSSNVDTLYDQSGNARDMTDGTVSTRRPSVTTAGPNSITAASFDGSTDYLVTAAGLSTFIANNAGFGAISCVVRGITLNNATPYLNDFIFGDQSQFMGLYARNTVGGTLYAYNWDGNADTQNNTFSTSTAYVFTWRHDSGSLFLGINGTESTGTASGNTSTMTGTLDIGARGGTQFSQIDVFEACIYSTVPSSGDRTTIVNALKSYVGA